MTRLIKNRIIITLISAWVLYWPAVLIVPSDILLEFINGMTAAVCAGLLVAFTPGAWSVMRDRPYRLSSGHLIVLGLTVMSLANLGLFTWGWIYRVFDAPIWMVEHPALRGWFIYLYFLGALLPLLANDVDHEAMPTRGWIHIGMVVAVGLGVVVLLVLSGGYSIGLASVE